jgi:hypothetical protein
MNYGRWNEMTNIEEFTVLVVKKGIIERHCYLSNERQTDVLALFPPPLTRCAELAIRHSPPSSRRSHLPSSLLPSSRINLTLPHRDSSSCILITNQWQVTNSRRTPCGVSSQERLLVHHRFPCLVHLGPHFHQCVCYPADRLFPSRPATPQQCPICPSPKHAQGFRRTSRPRHFMATATNMVKAGMRCGSKAISCLGTGSLHHQHLSTHLKITTA